MKASFDEDNELNALMLTNNKIKSPPGSKYRYSNIGYWLAGKVIEKVSGKSYQTYIEENVFTPLNLKNDQVSFTINESKLAKGHLKRFSPMGMIAPLMMDRDLFTSIDMSWIEIKAVHVYGPSYGGAGYHSEMRIYPNERLASVIIANRTSYDVAGKLNLLDKRILAEIRPNY